MSQVYFCLYTIKAQEKRRTLPHISYLELSRSESRSVSLKNRLQEK